MLPRDEDLDCLRGFAMFWVIFVHVLYWGGVFSEYPAKIVKSFFLFEMPLFFFIAGAGNGMGNKKGYIQFLLKRFCRILIPYWVYAGICILIILIHETWKQTLTKKLVLQIILTWMIPIGKQISPLPYFSYALWFVPVYLAIMVFFPLMVKCYFSKYKYLGFLILVLLYLLTLLFPYQWIRPFGIRQVAFYSIWTYTGLFYGNIKKAAETNKQWRKHRYICAIVGAFSMIILGLLGYQFDMQANKSTQNLMFFAFSFTVSSIFFVKLPFLLKLLRKLSEMNHWHKIYKIFMKRSMTIYLYQSFIFITIASIWNRLSQMLNLNSSLGLCFDLVQAITYYIIVILGSAAIAVVLGNIEDIHPARLLHIIN